MTLLDGQKQGATLPGLSETGVLLAIPPKPRLCGEKPGFPTYRFGKGELLLFPAKSLWAILGEKLSPFHPCALPAAPASHAFECPLQSG
ncbi:hypothetical protein [Kamptonema formosum]|uniref:hypothetical protein n=1 Tax=Kamptonema formosum TaxID=331992 RepID=UPI00034DAC88|nr:hypothetical protein [Oscillatoria sp. PCC 10802]